MAAPPTRDRCLSALAVAVLHAAALWWLLHARTPAVERPDAAALATFDVPPAPPPPAPRAKRAAPRGAAGRRAVRSPVVAPLPIVAPPLSPMAAAPLADTGAAAVGGGADAGSGTGASGTGSGAGAGGTGDGGGTHAQLRAGAIRNRDYPRDARKAGVTGTVTVRFTVGIDGRAHDCAVMRSSGSAALDTVTCRLIAQRFRYDPSRDAAGRPRAEERGWQQRWWIEE